MNKINTKTDLIQFHLNKLNEFFKDKNLSFFVEENSNKRYKLMYKSILNNDKYYVYDTTWKKRDIIIILQMIFNTLYFREIGDLELK